jgi:hypothetical protein
MMETAPKITGITYKFDRNGMMVPVDVRYD